MSHHTSERIATLRWYFPPKGFFRISLHCPLYFSFDLICLGILEESVHGITTMLHNTGFVVWHNVPKMRDFIVIDPQWLADALASVVSFMCQSAVSHSNTITHGKILELLKLRYEICLHFFAFVLFSIFFILFLILHKIVSKN